MWATASISTRRSGFDNGANTVERAGYGSLKYSAVHRVHAVDQRGVATGTGVVDPTTHG
jgi:hypothetical protein